jgi:unsaturated chondroitin disaccharide hydrolase
VVDLVSSLVDRVGSTLLTSAGRSPSGGRSPSAGRSPSGGRFPEAADPETGEWTWTADGSWSGGYWPGLLRLAGIATGDATYARAAVDAAAPLAARTQAPTILRGMLFWYGLAVPEVSIAAAESLAADFDPVAGVLPCGAQDVSAYGWPRPGVVVDGLPGTVPLLAFAASRSDVELRPMAEAYARAVVALCVREDGSVAQSATYEPDGSLIARASLNGVTPESTWARGQAWGMLGLAQAAALSAEFEEPAARVADWWLAHVPSDLVSWWDFDDPGTLRDTSASAIAAAALALLGGDRYRRAAADTVTALTGLLGPHGGLIEGCAHPPASGELVWGDYFLLEAALRLADAL